CRRTNRKSRVIQGERRAGNTGRRSSRYSATSARSLRRFPATAARTATRPSIRARNRQRRGVLPHATYAAYGLGLRVNQPLSRLSGAPPAARIDVQVTLGEMPSWRSSLMASPEIWQIRQQPGAREPWLTVWTAGPHHIRLAYFDGVEVLLSRDGADVW